MRDQALIYVIIHVGRDLVAVRQRPESGTIRRRTTVPRHQHICHQPVSVALNCAAQYLQIRRHAFVGTGNITQRGQPV